MHECQRTKNEVSNNKKDYLDFMGRCFDNENVVNAANALLPFDNVISFRLRFVNENSLVKSMGFSLLRMEIVPAIFSLGISIELRGGGYNQQLYSTVFIKACQTLEQLKEYVKSKVFSSHVTDSFDAEVDKSFYS